MKRMILNGDSTEYYTLTVEGYKENVEVYTIEETRERFGDAVIDILKRKPEGYQLTCYDAELNEFI